MPEALNQLILLACLRNLSCYVDMSFLETPVHGLLLNSYQVDHQIRAVDEVPDVVIIPGIEILDLDHLQHVLHVSGGFTGLLYSQVLKYTKHIMLCELCQRATWVLQLRCGASSAMDASRACPAG